MALRLLRKIPYFNLHTHTHTAFMNLSAICYVEYEMKFGNVFDLYLHILRLVTANILLSQSEALTYFPSLVAT